jgi:hypothetical protein
MDTDNKITDVLEKDKMAGIFYVIYGINDWMFFYFFLVFYKCSSKDKNKKKNNIQISDTPN